MHNRTPDPKALENSNSSPSSKLQESNSLKKKKAETHPLSSPPLAAAYLLSITVNITEQEVEGWEEAKHKPAAQCTCLAAACSDIWGHGDLVERADAHWCTGTGTWQLHKWLKQKKKKNLHKHMTEKEEGGKAEDGRLTQWCVECGNTRPGIHSRVDMAHWHAHR